MNTVVTYVQRRPRVVGNYSVERYFDTVRRALPSRIATRTVLLRYESRGLWRRIYNTIQSVLSQRGISHVTGDITYVGLLMRRRSTVVTILDCVFETHPSALRRAIIRLFWYELPVRRAAIVTVISEFTRRQLLAHTRCEPRKVRVIPVCVGDEFKRCQFVTAASERVVLLVGTAPNKNLERSCEALVGLDLKLKIIGSLTPAQKTLLAGLKLNYENHVNIDSTAMVRAYEECCLLLFASTYEGFGMPIIEAQTIGRPVITSNLASMPEIAGGGAVLVDPFSPDAIRGAVVAVLGDNDLRQRLIAAGFENASKYQPKVIADLYADVYDSLGA